MIATHISQKSNDRRNNKVGWIFLTFSTIAQMFMIIWERLTVDFSHGSREIRRIFEANEAEAFCFVGTGISDHFSFLKRWEFSENAS